MKKQAAKNAMVGAGVSAAMVLAIAVPASAHHSPLGIDMNKTEAAEATIKEFRWGAPHSAAVFVMIDKDGKPQDINVASSSPAMLLRQGFKVKDFKPGTKVQITWHPVKSGVLGGMLATVKLPDGRVFKDIEFGPGGGPPAGGPPRAGGPAGPGAPPGGDGPPRAGGPPGPPGSDQADSAQLQ